MPNITFSKTTYDLWRKEKLEQGYGKKSNSAFAHHLLLMQKRSTATDSSSCDSETEEEILADVILNVESDTSVNVTAMSQSSLSSKKSTENYRNSNQPYNPPAEVANFSETEEQLLADGTLNVESETSVNVTATNTNQSSLSSEKSTENFCDSNHPYNPQAEVANFSQDLTTGSGISSHQE